MGREGKTWERGEERVESRVRVVYRTTTVTTPGRTTSGAFTSRVSVQVSVTSSTQNSPFQTKGESGERKEVSQTLFVFCFFFFCSTNTQEYPSSIRVPKDQKRNGGKDCSNIGNKLGELVWYYIIIKCLSLTVQQRTKSVYTGPREDGLVD